jgi:hypothetical protein
MHRQKQNWYVRQTLANYFSGVDAAEHWHGDIQND